MKKVKVVLTVIILLMVIFLLFMAQKIYDTKKTEQVSAKEEKTDTIWVGTIQLAWDKLKEKIGHDIEFENSSQEQSELVNKLNSSKFNEEMLSSDSYTVIADKITPELRKSIENELNGKSQLLKSIDWKTKGENYLIYSKLNKSMSFKLPFDRLEADNFNGQEPKVKYFGINASSSEQLYDIVNVMLYNGKQESAVSLDTVEGDKIILYRTGNIEKSLEQIWQELNEKSSNYAKKKKKTKFAQVDTLKVPFIKFNENLRYRELEGNIKDSNGAIIQEVLQTVNFSLDDNGANVSSETKMNVVYKDMEARDFEYNAPFVIFLVENNQPYFACKVNDTNYLESE